MAQQQGRQIIIVMKKILSISALLVITLTAAAQQSKAIPDSLVYLLPNYAQGTIIYNNGEHGQGLLNICALDHVVRFLNGKQIMYLENDDIATRVSIEGHTFVKNKDKYYELMDMVEDMSYAELREVVILPEVAEGAFGGRDITSSAKKYDTFTWSSGVTKTVYDLSYPIEARYDYKVKPYFYKKNRFYPATLKNLEKLLPDRKADIEAFVEANGTNWAVAEDVRALILSLL